MKKTNKFLMIVICMLFSFATFANGTITGKVLDADNNESLIGATIMLEGTTYGSTANLDGSFLFAAPAGSYSLLVSFVGYLPQTMDVTISEAQALDLGTIMLKTSSIGLVEVSVFADLAVTRKTPVAVSSVSAQTIERELGNQEFPEILKMTPGVYATKTGGGFGDSRINVRGFDQRNVAVMINGIPVNDMENGWVYWSNWAGLADAAKTFQVQRGLGASKLAINSVGGTLNIITKTSEARKGGFIENSFSDYGTKKTKIGLNTGLLDGGWAVSFIGSRTEGEGYIDGTWIDAWNYFLSVSKEINKDHKLQFTVIGAPQKHGQRVNDQFHALSDYTKNTYGIKYNEGLGYLYGKQMAEKTNYYHKPQIALNWYWNINDDTFLSTSAYVSFGKGGGSGLLGTGWWKYNVPKTPTGQYDWNQSVEENASNEDGSASQILRNSVNSHNWYGILSTLKHDFSDELKLTTGIDGRYYKGIHYREVRDLLGAEFWDDSYRSYKSGNSRAVVGDKIDYNNDGLVSYLGLFSQLEYSKDDFSTFVALSLSETWYKRVDYFNYDATVVAGKSVYTGVESTRESQFGYNLKTGLNYNLDETSNIFVNAGYYAKAPLFDVIFMNFSNDVNPDYGTEKVIAAEFGYGYNSRNFIARINTYYTQWKDRWLDGYYADPVTGEGNTVYYQGLDQIHYGIEAEMSWKVSNNLLVATQISLGNWKYGADVPITIFDDDRQVVGTSTIYTDGLHVADAPQTQIGLAVKWNITDDIDYGMNWVFYDRLYSKFSPEDRDDPDDRADSYRLPNYSVMDMRIGWSFKLAGLDSYASMNVYNALNTMYRAEGWDNVQRNAAGNYAHDAENFAGFWGWGRNYNFSLRINF